MNKLSFPGLLLLALAINLGITSLALAQTPTPTPRDSIIKEIKAHAARHAESDSPLHTQMIVELYSENTVGLSPQEIAQIYEEEYVNIKQAQKPSPWDQLIPNLGWMLALILLFVLAIRDVLKEKLTNLINSVWNYLYNRLSGNRLFRAISLSCYQTALIEKYGQLKIPFRPERPLKMHDVYVPLRMVGSVDKLNFDAYEVLANHRKIMIVGPPGSGKSMLLKHIMLRYAEGALSHLPDESIPTLVELHRLNDPKTSLEQQIVDEFTRNGFPNSDSFVLNSLDQGTLFLLLDGLDEVNSGERGRVVTALKDALDKYDKCRVILTCRTAVYRGEFAETAERTLEVVEFTDQQIRGFLQSWEQDMAHGKSIEQLMLTLKDRPRIMALARNPLMLTIITYLYTDTNLQLPHSRTEFYRKSTDILLDVWHQEHNLYKATDKRHVLQHLAFFNQDSPKSQSDRRSIDFHDALDEVKRVLPSLNLNPEEDTRPLIDEIVERSGLLLEIDGGERFQFAHLTLQEYFAAAELKDNSKALVTRFNQDPDAWRETIKLWCGLDIDSTALIHQIHRSNPVTAFECLADAQKVNQSLANKIITEFKQEFGRFQDQEALIRAFAAVASDKRPRGTDVFNFLKEVLEANPNPELYTAATRALSQTNLPEAAMVLASHYANHYANHYVARSALVHMGDLAVPFLASFAQSGVIEAIDDLQVIRTPRAAMILTSLLWDDDARITEFAAWRLATLFSEPGVEDALRQYEPAKQHINLPWVDWIWEPFEEPASSAVSIIAGRVAHIISEASIDTAPPVPYKPDPRLIIPIVAIVAANQLKAEILKAQSLPELSKLATEKGVNSGLYLYNLGEGSQLRSRQRQTILRRLFDALLDEDDPTNQAAQEQFSEYVLQRISDPKYALLLSSLTPNLRFKILRYLLEKTPSPQDWSNIHNPLEYQFRYSWHSRLIWIIAAILTIFALSSMLTRVFAAPDISSLNNVFALLAAITILIGWGFFIHPKFGAFDIHGILISIACGLIFIPYALLVLPLYLIILCYGYLKDKSNRHEVINHAKEFAEMSAIILLMGVFGTVWIGSTLYYTTITLTLYTTWQNAILTWVILLVIGALLVKLGLGLEGIASNPLRNCIQPKHTGAILRQRTFSRLRIPRLIKRER